MSAVRSASAYTDAKQLSNAQTASGEGLKIELHPADCPSRSAQSTSPLRDETDRAQGEGTATSQPCSARGPRNCGSQS